MTFYLFNCWGENDGRFGMPLSFSMQSVKILPKEDKSNWVPWKFEPVPGTSDQFYIVNKWGAHNERRHGMYLSFSETSAMIYPLEQEGKVPWKVQPVPGKSSQFYLLNQWACDRNEGRCGMNLSFDGYDVKLYPSEMKSEWVPWFFLPTNNHLHLTDDFTNDYSSPKLSGHKPALGETHLVKVGSKKIPFLLVNDPEYTPYEQQIKSPFYTLDTYTCWIGHEDGFVGNEHNDAASKSTISTSHLQSETLEKTVMDAFSTGVEITGSVGFEFQGVGASLDVTTSHEWHREVEMKRSSLVERSISIEREMAVNPGHSSQLFVRAVKERLLRQNGDLVREWVIKSGTTAIASFPETSEK